MRQELNNKSEIANFLNIKINDLNHEIDNLKESRDSDKIIFENMIRQLNTEINETKKNNETENIAKADTIEDLNNRLNQLLIENHVLNCQIEENEKEKAELFLNLNDTLQLKLIQQLDEIETNKANTDNCLKNNSEIYLINDLNIKDTDLENEINFLEVNEVLTKSNCNVSLECNFDGDNVIEDAKSINNMNNVIHLNSSEAAQSSLEIVHLRQENVDLLAKLEEKNAENIRINQNILHLNEVINIKSEEFISLNIKFEEEKQILLEKIELLEKEISDLKLITQSEIKKSCQCEEFQKENSHLKNDFTILKQQTHEMLCERDINIAQLDNDNNNLKKEIASFNQLEIKLQTLESKILELTVEKEKLNEDLQLISTENTNVKMLYSKMESEYNALKIIYDNFKSEHVDGLNHTNSEEEIILLKQSYGILQQENAYYKENFDYIQTQANQMLYERDVKISELTNHIEDLKRDFENLTTLNDALKANINELTVKYDEESKLNAEKISKLNIYIEESKEKLSINEKLLTERNELKEKLFLFDKIIDENNDLKETISVYQLNEIKMNETISLHQENETKLNETITEQKQFKRKLQETISEYQLNEKKFNEEIKSLQQQITFKDNEIKQLSQELNDKYTTIDKLIQTNSNNHDNQTMFNDVEYLKKRCLFLEEQLHRSRFICEKILKKLEVLKVHNESFNIRFQTVKTMASN